MEKQQNTLTSFPLMINLQMLKGAFQQMEKMKRTNKVKKKRMMKIFQNQGKNVSST
jgi:hypothetical protein